MGYKWLPLTEDFDRSLPISKIRWDTSIYTYESQAEANGYLSEKPNIYADGRAWSEQQGETWGYATENRFNPTTVGDWANCFSNRYYGFTDEKWTATTHTTLVSGTTYEFVCPVPLYFAGLESAYTASLAEKIHYYVEVGMSISTDSETVSVDGSSFSVDITSENPWTASTTDSWVTLSSTTGLTDATITVTIPDNYNKPQRVGTVTFTDGEDTLTLTITQNADTRLLLKNIYRNGNSVKAMFRNGQKIYQQLFKLIFSVDTDEIIFENSGGTYTINITANERWTMTVPNWLTASSLSGTGNASIVLSTNSVPDSKLEGEIIINCLNKSYSIDVLQKGVGPDLSQPLTFEFISGGTFTIPAGSRPVVYKYNNNDWVTQTSNLTLSVGEGDTIKVKYTGTTSNWQNISFSSSNCKFNVYGNIHSLLSKDNYEEITSLSSMQTFLGLFRYTGVVDASGLLLPATTLYYGCYDRMFQGCTSLTTAPSILPATTLAEYCYGEMFYGCSSLAIAPELPATTLTNWCYIHMFQNCSSLNYIKCLATDISATRCTENWISSSQGTFVKNPLMNDWPRNSSGIPGGWIIIDA